MKVINLILYSLVSCICMFNNLLAQTTGDYRSTATSITWSTASDWQTWNGSNWVTASSAPGASNDVYIQAGHTVTLTGNQSCNSLFISTGTTNATTPPEGLVALQGNTLNVNGKLVCYFGVVDITINSTSSLSPSTTTTVHNPTITKTSSGVLKIVGNSRNITNTGEWSAPGSGSSNLFDIEIDLNAGQTATFQTNLKAANWVFTTGTTNMGNNRIAADNGTTGQGDVTIGVNAIVINSSTGSGSNSVISQTGTVATGRGGTLTINGLLRLSGQSPYIECTTISMGNSGIVDYSQGGSQNFINTTFTGAAPLLNYSNIILSGSGPKTTLPSQATAIASNGSLTMSGGTLALGASGSFSVSSTGTTLNYSGNSTQTATSTEWLSNFQNLTINNSSGVLIGGLARTINGNLTLTSGTFTNSTTLTLGNGATITRSGGILNSVPTFGSSVNVIYNQNGSSISTGNELPTSTSVLNNLTINSSNGVILSASKTMNGTLTFTSGQFSTTASNLLTIETTGSVSGYSNSSFISGPISKNTNSAAAFIFPIGKGSLLRTIAVTPTNSNSTTYSAEYFDAAYSNTTSFTSPITRVSTIDYFELNRSTGGTPSDASIEMAWGINSGVNTADVGELTLSRFAGGNWVNESATGTGTSTSGSVVSNSAANSFGTFALANSTTNTNLLPVQLINFTSEYINPVVHLKWSTASEINSKDFELEISINGKDFTLLDFISTKAMGGLSNKILHYTYINNFPNSGISYYRLKQNDLNGEFKYSPIIISKLPELQKIKIIDKFLHVYNQEGYKNTLQLLDLNGVVIYETNFENSLEINLSPYHSGAYLCCINGFKPIRFIVK